MTKATDDKNIEVLCKCSPHLMQSKQIGGFESTFGVKKDNFTFERHFDLKKDKSKFL